MSTLLLKNGEKSTVKNMKDSCGRYINYLRVSVTDRCDFRCAYCMAEDMTFLPKNRILTLAELYHVCKIFVKIGIRKIRITGGEPLVRKNILWLLERLGELLQQKALQEITITTNGSMLERYAENLIKCGIKRINVSLDSLDEYTFASITRSKKYGQVLRGIARAKAAGLKVKINTVALRNINDTTLTHMVDYAIENGFDITFIEVMPMGDLGNESRLAHFLPLTIVKKNLEKKFRLSPSMAKTNGPSTYYAIEGAKETKIGFIAPLSHNFCDRCNRLRLTCTGTIYPCLGQDNKVELLPIIRSKSENNAIAIENAIIETIKKKPAHHDFIISKSSQVSVERHMNVTGG